MSRKMLNIKRVDFSTDQLLMSVFHEVKDILNTQVHLHETMMRTSELYKTTYTEMTERMKTLQEKLPSVSPAILSLLLDYTKIAAISINENSENRKRKYPKTSLPKAKKAGKMNERQPYSKKNKTTRKTKKEVTSPVIKPRTDVTSISPTASQSSPSLLIEPVTPPTEPNFDDRLPKESVLNDLRLDYTQLMEDIEQQEKQDRETNVAGDSCSGIVEDSYEEEKLTPLQKNCGICRHNNMLRYISCNSGEVQCHVCCMDLMNCLCYHDPEGMMEDMISQDFEGHILTV